MKAYIKEVRADVLGELWKHCRHKMKYRKHIDYKRKTVRRTLIPNHVSIYQPPAEANCTRSASGKWIL